MLRYTIVAFACWGSSVQGDVGAATAATAAPDVEEVSPADTLRQRPLAALPKPEEGFDPLPLATPPKQVTASKTNIPDPLENDQMQNGEQFEDQENTMSPDPAYTVPRQKPSHYRTVPQQIRTESDRIAAMIKETGVLGPELSKLSLSQLKVEFNKEAFQKALTEKMREWARTAYDQKMEADNTLASLDGLQKAFEAFFQVQAEERMPVRDRLRLQQGRGRAPSNYPYGMDPEYDQGAYMPPRSRRSHTSLLLFALWCGAAGLLFAALVTKIIKKNKENKADSGEPGQISLVDV